MTNRLKILSIKILFALLFYCLSINKTIWGQTKIDTAKKTTRSVLVNQKPEVLTNGFIDVVNNGQLNASARLIRLFVGEPGKFVLPLSVYSGVTANSLQNTTQSPTSIINRNNDQLYNNFINPLSGLANISIDGIAFFKKNSEKITKVGFLYHAGEKILTGFKSGPISNPQTGRPINFLSSVASTGLYFQTGAWERTNAKNVGILWMTLRYIFSYSNPQNLKDILPNIETNGIYTGYSLGWGVEINNLLNLKVVFYKYLKEPEINYSLPIYQFQFNYSLK
jgi:hypothetical protein